MNHFTRLRQDAPRGSAGSFTERVFLIMGKEEELEKEIEELEEKLQDREDALPAHSIRPHQLLIIEELEIAIEEKKKELEALRKKEA